MSAILSPSTDIAPDIAPTAPRLSVRALAGALVDVRAVLVIAAGLIGGTLWWCLRQSYNVIVSYADAPTHLNLARRVHDDLHPGLGQLGAYWLPLAHVIELPFVWNDALWRSGLAGAIPSMGCYLLSVWLIYHLALLATDGRVPAVIAALAFAANPNVLYLHVTPMFEPAIIASVLGATYALARWLRDGGFFLLIVAAAAMSVVATSRYEAWAVVAGSAVVIVMALWQRGDRGALLRGRLLFYLVLAWYGMALWLLWNLALNGDALYFLHPSFNKGLHEATLAVLTKRRPAAATAYVFFAVADNAGPILVGLGALGLWRFAAGVGLRARGLWLYLLAAPALFDIFYLWYKGTPPITVPQLVPHTSGNIRYGLVTFPLLCLLAAYLARRPTVVVRGPRAVALALLLLRRNLPYVWPLAQATLLALVLAQPLLILRHNRIGGANGVVTYEEANNRAYRLGQVTRVTVARWLAGHYDGGLVLMSTFKGADRVILASGLPDRAFVHEGSQNTWRCALARPQRWVRWIVLYKGRDGAARLLSSRSVAGQEYFRLLHDVEGSQTAGYLIYRRNARPWRPARPGACG